MVSASGWHGGRGLCFLIQSGACRPKCQARPDRLTTECVLSRQAEPTPLWPQGQTSPCQHYFPLLASPSAQHSVPYSQLPRARETHTKRFRVPGLVLNNGMAGDEEVAASIRSSLGVTLLAARIARSVQDPTGPSSDARTSPFCWAHFKGLTKNHSKGRQSKIIFHQKQKLTRCHAQQNTDFLYIFTILHIDSSIEAPSL